MKFQCALLAVKDIEVSKKFYKDIFEQTVILDLGWNVTLSGGFALQQEFAWLCDLPKDSVVQKSHNMELYFDEEDFDAFIQKLERYPEVQYVHKVKTYEWKQRVVRLYDPDFHIIEIGESMSVIARRYLSQGYSVEETAKEIQHPIEFVEKVKNEKI